MDHGADGITGVSMTGSGEQSIRARPEHHHRDNLRQDHTAAKDGDRYDVASITSTTSDTNEEIYTPSTHPLQRQATLSKSYTAAEERAVIKKLDTHLVGFLALLYLLSFLDRSNIGNARIAGLETALNISSRQFDWCLIAFYVTYITFEWMILLYKLLPPHVYISLCVFCWGVVASLQSCVTSFPQLLTLRALLGVTEAAFGPGVPFYMTFFYKREELAYRVGLQISAAPLATALASSIAWVILKLNTHTGLEGWRALFLFEGTPSILVAFIAWYWIPDGPSTARFLSPRQRKAATLRLRSDSPPASLDTKHINPRTTTWPTSRIAKSDLISTLLDPKSWLTALMFLSVNVSFASLPVFLPTIINSMSFSPLTSQILAAPPYLAAFIFVLLIGHYSDKIPNSRGVFLCAVAFLSCISYGTIALAGLLHDKLGNTLSIIIRYVAIHGAAMGLFSAVTLIITWTLNNQRSSTGKGMGMVILNVVGQCGPLIGVQLFPETQGPLYVPGMAVCAGFMGGVVILSVGLRVYLTRLNGLGDGDRSKEIEMVGSFLEGKSGAGVEEEEEGLMDGRRKLDRDQVFRYML